MSSVQTPFEQLAEVLRLFKDNKQESALFLWSAVPEEFRIKVLQYAIVCSQISAAPPDAVIDTPYGKMHLNQELVSDLLHVLPQIANAFTSRRIRTVPTEPRIAGV